MFININYIQVKFSPVPRYLRLLIVAFLLNEKFDLSFVEFEGSSKVNRIK